MLDDKIRQDQTVLISGDRIYSVGVDIELPDSATVINTRGKYLMPGLAEMHGHTPIPGGDASSQFVKDMMFLYVANGVTTVRGLLGAPGQLDLKNRIVEGDLLGPTLYLAGPSFSGGSITSDKQAILRVEQQVAEGWDLLKVHPGLNRSQYDAMATTAHNLGIRFGGHVPEDVGLIHAIKMGQHTFDHIDGYLQQLNFPDTQLNEADIQSLVNLSRDARVWIVPTLVLWDHVIGLGNAEEKKNWQENAYWPKKRVDRWYRSMKQRANRGSLADKEAYSKARSRMLQDLHKGGVGILMGTDSPQIFSVPGFSIHREMAAMEKTGMSSYEVLVSGTRNVADYLQGSHSLGVIAPGHQADLILVNDNPLVDLSTISVRSGVMVRGRWIPASEIDSELKSIRDRMSQL
jgi:imidazolonepropionase-like amidohydrolase